MITEEILKARQMITVDLSTVETRYHRILTFDPAEIYNRLEGRRDPYKRNQSVPIDLIFPDQDGKCACGCGTILTGRRKRYATDVCKSFVLRVYFILRGDSDVITRVIGAVYGHKCCMCGKTSMELDRPNIRDDRTPIELEHTLPVKHGGGGSWLSNYTLMCYLCHREKTNKDFGYKSKQEKSSAGSKNLLF
jgi:5-methylcytosine-specific restriction endonuclease McrA